MKLFMKKVNGSLAPVDKASNEILEGLNYKDYEVTVKQGRNLQFHRKFFSLLNAVIDMTEHYGSMAKVEAVDMLKERIKYKMGYFTIMEVNGVGIPITKSIAFNKMSGTVFEAFYSGAIDVILTDNELGINADIDTLEKVMAYGG